MFINFVVVFLLGVLCGVAAAWALLSLCLNAHIEDEERGLQEWQKGGKGK